VFKSRSSRSIIGFLVNYRFLAIGVVQLCVFLEYHRRRHRSSQGFVAAILRPRRNGNYLDRR